MRPALTSASPGADDSSVDDDLSECLDSLGLVQPVKEPTRCLPGVANLLDVLATSNSTIVGNVKVDSADCLSDHCLISADITLRLPKPVITYSSRNIRAVDAAQFQDHLHKTVLFTQPANTTVG